MKTVLIYVLSAHIPPWRGMVASAKETWDAEPIEGTETIYYSGNPPAATPEPRVIQFDINEAYQTMGRKNLLAYRAALQWPWDYMARAHSSTYVHKRRLLEYCQTLPDTGLVSCTMLGPTFVCGTERNWAWGGGHFVFSRDVIAKIVENEQLWRHDVMEDVATSEIVQDLGFTPQGNGLSSALSKQPDGSWTLITYGGKSPSFTFTDFADINKAPEQFFFRCKHDGNRAIDLEAMRLLKQHLSP